MAFRRSFFLLVAALAAAAVSGEQQTSHHRVHHHHKTAAKSADELGESLDGSLASELEELASAAGSAEGIVILIEGSAAFSGEGSGEVGWEDIEGSYDEDEDEEYEDEEYESEESSEVEDVPAKKHHHKKGWLGSAWDDVTDTISDAYDDAKSAVEDAYDDTKDFFNGTESESASASGSVEYESEEGSEEEEKKVALASETQDDSNSSKVESFMLIGGAVGAAVGLIAVALVFAVRSVRQKAGGSVLTDDEAAVAMAGADEEADEDESDEDVEAGALVKEAGDDAKEAEEEEGKFEGSV